jgi:hypothetical protein
MPDGRRCALQRIEERITDKLDASDRASSRGPNRKWRCDLKREALAFPSMRIARHSSAVAMPE